MINLKEKKILIAGANGQLGKAFSQYFSAEGINYYSPDESEFDITSKEKITKVISKYVPDYLINCAAYNLVDQAEEDDGLVFKINSEAPGILADACKEKGIFLVHYSSDYVFDGEKGGVYTEEDIPNPLNIYGKSKLKGEQVIQEKIDNHLIFRLSWVIGKGQQNFLYKLSQWAQNNPTLKISNDEISVPTFTGDIVNATLLSLQNELKGLYHLVSSGYASRYELAQYYLECMKLNNSLEEVSIKSFNTKAKRPLFSAMINTKISKALNITIPSWKEAMDKFLECPSFEGRNLEQ